MPLFKKDAASHSSRAPSVTREAVDASRAGFLHALDEEIWRARRYGRPLSIFIAGPRLLPAERLSSGEVEFASRTVGDVLRRSDASVWLQESFIAGILPETNADQARAAAYRLRGELERRTVSARRRNWRVATVPLGDEESAEILLDALFARYSEDVD